MPHPVESLSGMTTRDKVVTAEEAVALIRDGDTVVVELRRAVFRRGTDPGAGGAVPADRDPAGSDAGVRGGAGDRKGRGSDRLCHPGLIKRALGGHWGMSGELGKLAVQNAIEPTTCRRAWWPSCSATPRRASRVC